MTAVQFKIRVFPPFGEPFSEVYDCLRSCDPTCKTIKDGEGYYHTGTVSPNQYREIWNIAEETGGSVEIIQRLEISPSCDQVILQKTEKL